MKFPLTILGNIAALGPSIIVHRLHSDWKEKKTRKKKADHIPPKMYELIASVRVIPPCSCLDHTAIAASPSPYMYNHIQNHDYQYSVSHFLTYKHTINDTKTTINNGKNFIHGWDVNRSVNTTPNLKVF